MASVPQRSPFRYPGGKTWLVPRVREWLMSRQVSELVEPFAGGAIVGLTAAFEGLADRVTLVELDDDVAAVWKTILGGDADWLANRVATFTMTPEAVEEVLSGLPRSMRERAFATIVRNRVNRGGIMAPGAGRLKHGENGKGLSSRWYARTLCRRIMDIAAISCRIRFVHGDGIKAMADMASRDDVAFFVDPPYTVAGRRLYTHNELDHSALFDIASDVRGDFLMTYDESEEIADLANAHALQVRRVLMKTTHHLHKTELLIGRELTWVRP